MCPSSFLLKCELSKVIFVLVINYSVVVRDTSFIYTCKAHRYTFFLVLSLLVIRDLEDHVETTYWIRYSAVLLISHTFKFCLTDVLTFFQCDYGERCATLICHDKGGAFLLLEFCGNSINIFDMIFTETRIVHAISRNSWRKVWKWWSLRMERVWKLRTCTLNV